jgi:hypothetical protein
MYSRLLLPNRFKRAGWFILIPATIAGILVSITGYEPDWLNASAFAFINDDLAGKSHPFSFISVNLTNTLVGVLFIVGAFFVGCSKEKEEDEFIARLRLSSLLWAVWVNYVLLLLAFLFVYGTPFLTVMIYNMFTVMIIFIARFNYILYKGAKSVQYEK